MAENGEQPAEPKAAAQPQAAAPQISQKVLAQYVRDLSFENVVVQKGLGADLKPEIKVQVSIDARKRTTENQYEVIVKLNIKSATADQAHVLFILELDYGTLFEIKGLSEEQIHPYLMIECPRLMFPFFRRVVHDVTRDGGFPPLNLENIDFMGLYRNEIAKRVQAQAAAGGTPPAQA